MNLPAAAFTVHDPSLAQQKLAAYAVTNPDNITQTKQRNFHVTAILKRIAVPCTAVRVQQQH